MRRAALALVALGALGMADSKVVPGAYCPLPEGDEPPACLEPAAKDYERFFAGLEEGQMDDAALAEVERDLAGARRYEALSSIVFAYYVLSRRAAAGPSADPGVAARLERWNAMLGDTYRASDDGRFRDAMRRAAGDLRTRAPAVPVRCGGARPGAAECSSTEAFAAAVAGARDRTGLRGALGRVLDRLTGGSD